MYITRDTLKIHHKLACTSCLPNFLKIVFSSFADELEDVESGKWKARGARRHAACLSLLACELTGYDVE